MKHQMYNLLKVVIWPLSTWLMYQIFIAGECLYNQPAICLWRLTEKCILCCLFSLSVLFQKDRSSNWNASAMLWADAHFSLLNTFNLKFEFQSIRSQLWRNKKFKLLYLFQLDNTTRNLHTSTLFFLRWFLVNKYQ